MKLEAAGLAGRLDEGCEKKRGAKKDSKNLCLITGSRELYLVDMGYPEGEVCTSKEQFKFEMASRLQRVKQAIIGNADLEFMGKGWAKDIHLGSSV